HYALIDLFVVPRVDDRAARFVTPLKPLEAMAMRIPVITASLPALEELVEPGLRGLSFTPSDPTAIAATASELIESPSALKEFAQSAYDWVTKERTVESNADRYARILGPLLGGAPKR
ncbi:MAG: glycosyltransferase, partial [Acidimicrobiia bacterium]